MNVPKPPFRTVTEELLYNIYLRLQGGGNMPGLTTEDINSIAKLNAILQDVDLMSAGEITDSLAALKGDVPDVANTLGKLYNIIQGITSLKQDDIDTIAELNAIITDADLVRVADLAELLVSLNLKRKTVQFFLEPNFHERNVTVLKGKINSLSEDFTANELNSVSYKSRLDSSLVWIDHPNLSSLQNWINQFITGNENEGAKFWIRCLGNYKQGHNGDAMNLLTYYVTS
jgi:hypothetical protein